MNKISRCNICGQFLNSKRELKDHKDKNHRITNSKVLVLKKKKKKKKRPETTTYNLADTLS